MVRPPTIAEAEEAAVVELSHSNPYYRLAAIEASGINDGWFLPNPEDDAYKAGYNAALSAVQEEGFFHVVKMA